MKKIRILGVLLLILALLLSACGFLEETVPDSTPDAPAQQATLPSTSPTEEASQPAESEIPDSEPGESTPTETEANQALPVVYGEYYYDLENVVLYLAVYGELPSNYITKAEARALGWEGGSVENYKEGAAIGGDSFGNREGLLPEASGRRYTECDIDTLGFGSRGSRRLVFSNDGLYFYTSDHYETFTEIIVTEDYEVIR